MAMRCDGRPSGSGHKLSRRKCSRTPAGRAGRIAASLRFSARCRFSRKARRPTMSSWLLMRATFLRPICPIGPGIQGRSQDRLASFPRPGMPPMISGERCRCRTGSRRCSARRMTARDMQAWSAVRMIGEGAQEPRSFDPRMILDFLKGPDFALAAFKGQRLDRAGLESSASSADPSHRRQDGRLGVSAGRLSASGLGAGHAWRRPARKQMQVELMHEA